MATIKAYSDLQQSKKLTEILPLESADMHYIIMGDDEDPQTIVGLGEYIGILPTIPAWSLSALLELIPPYLGEFKDGIDFGFSKAINGKWYSAYYIKLDDNGLASFNKTVTGDTAIDAVFEMIVWLKENNKI